MGDLLARFKDHLVTLGISDGSIRNYLSDLNHFQNWLNNSYPKQSFAEINSEHPLAYRTYLVHELEAPVSSVNRRLSSLRQFFTWAVSQNLLPAHPMQGLSNISIRAGNSEVTPEQATPEAVPLQPNAATAPPASSQPRQPRQFPVKTASIALLTLLVLILASLNAPNFLSGGGVISEILTVFRTSPTETSLDPQTTSVQEITQNKRLDTLDKSTQELSFEQRRLEQDQQSLQDFAVNTQEEVENFDSTTENLIQNSSFELNSSGAPLKWQYFNFSDVSNTTVTTDSAHTGSNVLRFNLQGIKYGGLTQSQSKTRSDSSSALSVWVRGAGLSYNGLVKLGFKDDGGKYAAFQEFYLGGTFGWQRLTVSANGQGLYPAIEFRGYSTGSAYLDDWQLSIGRNQIKYAENKSSGQGSVETSGTAVITPVQDGLGSLGSALSRFGSLHLSNATIDSLGNLTIGGNTISRGVRPFSDRAYDLGTSTLYYRTVYAQSIVADGTLIGGDQTIAGNLTVIGTSNLVSSVTAGSDLSVAGNTTLTGILTTNSGIVTNNSNINAGTGSISGGSIAGATLTTTGNTSVGGTLVVTGATTLNNSLTVAGTSTLADLVTSGQIKLTGNTADRLLIQPTVDPGASTKLFAIKNAVGTEQFSLSSDGRLNIVDSATIGGATTITGLLSANGGIVTGNAAINAGTGAISGGAITGATLTTSSNVSVGGDLTVLGTTITATNVTTFNCTDCIDFDDLADNLTLDGSTNILATGTNFLSLTNTGTGNSFLVSDQASDASPFVIDAAGNVGIGSSSPSAKLLVNLDSGVNGKILTLGRSAGAYVYSFGVDASSKFQILDNDGTTVRLNIDPTTGNLGINTSSPAATLHARTQSQASTGELLAKLDVSDATAGYLNIANGTTGDTAFIPYLSGRGTSNLIDLYLEGNAPVGGDTGSNPVVNINASINGAAVTTRPLLNINNNGSLKIQVDAAGNFLPGLNAIYDIGSPGLYWDDGYFDNITANNINAVSTTIAGTTSNTFTINTDNATNDLEDMDLIFFRGTATPPNALISWKSASKQFELNYGTLIYGQGSVPANAVLTARGASGQTGDIFRVQNSTPSDLFKVGANGNITADTDTFFVDAVNNRVGIGTTAPSGKLEIKSSALSTNPLSIIASGTSSSLFQINEGGAGNANLYLYNSAGSSQVFLATSGDSYFTGGNVGIGTASPNNKLEILSTTAPQLRIAYDSSNYFTTAVSSAGAVTFDAGTAGFTFNDHLTLAANQNFTMTSGTGTFTQNFSGTGGSAHMLNLTGTSSSVNQELNNIAITNNVSGTVTGFVGTDFEYRNNSTITPSDTAVRIYLESSTGTDNVNNLLQILNNDADQSVSNAILINSTTSNLITDAIDVSDTNLVNALNFGDNVILGTTGNIDMTNFDVVGSTGNITTAGTLTVNGTGSSYIAGALTIQVGAQALNLKDTAGTTHSYMAWQDSSGVRKGFFGFPSNGSSVITLTNEITNGNIQLSPNGTGIVDIQKNTTIAGTLDVSGHGAFGGSVSVDTARVLNIGETFTDPSATSYGIRSAETIATTVDNANRLFGVLGVAASNTANNLTSGQALVGLEGNVQHTGTGTITGATGVASYVNNSSTGTISNLYKFYAYNGANTGTIINNYGLYVENQTVGTNDYGVYVAAADTSSIYLASTSGTSASGITFGGDTNLYRSAANTLKTDDDLVIGSTGNGKITVGVVDPYLITNTGTFQAALEFRTTATAGADDFIFTLDGTERARLTETGNLTIVGTLTAQSTSTSTFSGAIDMQNNVILNIGNSGTDFVATTGALNLAGVLTANGGITLGTSQTFSATSGTISATGLSSSTIGTTSANLTLSTTTSGTLALTSAGALNLSAGAASTVTLANVANAFNFDADTLSIDALNNRVGIGTVAPASKLEVSGGTGSVNLKITADTDNVNEADQPSITLSQDNGSVVSHIGFFDSNNAFSLYNSFGDSLSFGTSGRKNDVSIDLNGNLGVGAGFGPFTYKLQVAPTANATAGQTVFIQDATATTGSTNLVLRAGAGQSAANILTIQDNPGTTNWFTFSGTADNFSTISATSGRSISISPVSAELRFSRDGTSNVNAFIDDANGAGRFSVGGTGVAGARFYAEQEAAKTTAQYAGYFTNLATSSTASINKYGLYVSSTGTWNGTSANNYGLYVDTPTGGTNNYAAVLGAAGGNVGIGDASPSTRLSLGGTGSANGITFGDDAADSVNLYRSTTNTLKTDDDLVIGSTGNGKITVGVVDPYLITNTGTFQAALEFRTTATAGADDFIFTLGGVEKGRITEGGNLTVTGLVTAQGTGTNTFSGTVDMQSNLILNIGNAGTDFTTGGGLNLAGSLSVGAPTNGNAGIELGYTGGVATTPFIDLHSGATSVDYDARIIASGGTGATGNGLLSLNSSGVDVSGSYVEIGTTPATAGVLRLPNNTGINFRNAANTADIQALAIDASNNLALTTTAALNLSAGAASTFTLANVANALNFDSNTLSIDALNNRVGIGTNAPSKSLEVGGTGVSVTGGRVAIDGTDTAILAGEIALLENGGTLITSSRGSVQFALDNDNNETTASFTVGTNGLGSGLFTVLESGNVGIGLSPTEKLDVAGKIRLTSNSSAVYLDNADFGSWRDSKINLLTGLAGRLLNFNPDFLTGSTSEYAVYDNNASGDVTLAIVANAAAPNDSGNVMRVQYDPAGGVGVPSPNFGGFNIQVTKCTDRVSTDCYKEGNRYVWRIWANIPSGRQINWHTNSYGTGGTFNWLTSQDGTGGWKEYVAIQTIGSGGTFSSTGFFSISGGADALFTWDVAQVAMIGVDEPNAVVRSPYLNIGYSTTYDPGSNFGGLGVAGNALVAGNVGIGTTGPETKLDIAGGALLLDNNQQIQFESTGGSNLRTFDVDTGNNLNLGRDDSIGTIQLFGRTAIYDSAAGALVAHDFQTTTGTATVFNEQGIDLDLRMEGDTNANLFYLDASTDRIGIGTAIPANKLSVAGGNIQIDTATTVTALDRWIGSSATNGIGFDAGQGTVFTSTANMLFEIDSDNSDTTRKILFATNGDQFTGGETGEGTTLMAIQENGSVGIGTPSPGSRLDIQQTDTGNVSLDLSRFTLTDASNTNPVGNIDKFSMNVQYLKTGTAVQAGFENGPIWAGATVSGGSLTSLYGIQSRVQVATGGTVTNAVNFLASADFAVGGTLTSRFGLQVNDYGKAITNQAGVVVGAITSGGTGNTGVLIGTTTVPAGNYALYSASANASLFSGQVQITSTNSLSLNGGKLLIYNDGTNGILDANATGGDIVIRPAASADLRPYADNSFSLGTTSFRWADLQIGTGASLFGGAVTVGDTAGGNVLKLKPGTASDHTYLEFYADTASPTTRYGYIGYGSAGTSTLSIVSEQSGPLQITSASTLNISTASGLATWTLQNVANALNFDSNTLSIDALNNRVGIGNAAPGTTLDVTGTGRFSTTLTASSGFTLSAGALNLTSTSGALSVTGLGASTIGTTSANLTLSTTTSGTLALTSAGALNLSAGAASTWTLANVANALNFDSNTLSIDALNNRVGVGTSSPGEKLEVENGNILLDRSNLKLTPELPPGAPTVAINATAGNLNGTYNYQVTFVTASGETEGGTVSANVAPVSQQVNLTAIPTGTTGFVTARKIYRSTAGPTTPRKLVTTINDNSTTTYTDNIADASLGATLSNINTTASIQVTNAENLYLVAGIGKAVVIGDGTGKLTAGTFDPVYKIDGVNYSTYAPSMLGVKEEITGDVALSYDSYNNNYSYTINLANASQGSDLWVFSRISDPDINKTAVLVSANSQARVWYLKDAAARSITFFSDRATSISYRLTAPRFDHLSWGTLSEDQSTNGLNPPAATAPVGGESSSLIINSYYGAFSENFNTTGIVTTGDVLSVDSLSSEGKLTRSSGAYDSKITGVATSDGPIATVTSAGRVQVRASVENGDITPGDHLTSSGTKAGFAMKATAAGRTIGVALQSLTGSDGMILVSVTPSWFDPTAPIYNPNGTVAPSASSGSATYDTLTATTANITNLNVGGVAVVTDAAGNLKVNGNIVITGKGTFSEIRVNGVLGLYGGISAPNGLAINLGLSKAFEIRSDAGETVAQISDEGALIAKSAEISELKVSTGSAQPTTGTAIFRAGGTSMLIESTKITPTSKVVVTFKGDYGPATRYWITDEAAGESFTLHLDQAPTSDVSFNWWIIN